jgi:hypothetical protein
MPKMLRRRRPLRSRDKVQRLDSKPAPYQFNDPVLIEMIAEAKTDNADAERGSRAHFMAMLNHAKRLHRAKLDLNIAPVQFEAFAKALNVGRTDAKELWKLHPHRKVAIAWADVRIRTARESGKTVPRLYWRTFWRQISPDTEEVVGQGQGDPASDPFAMTPEQIENETILELRNALGVMSEAKNIAEQNAREYRARLEEAVEKLNVVERECDELRAEVERLRLREVG